MTPEHAAHDMLNRAQAGTVEVFEDGADLEAAGPQQGRVE